MVRHFFVDYEGYFLARHGGAKTLFSSVDKTLGQGVLHFCICLEWFDEFFSVLTMPGKTMKVENATILFRFCRTALYNLIHRNWVVSTNLADFVVKHNDGTLSRKVDLGLRVLASITSEGAFVDEEGMKKLLVLADLCYCALQDLFSMNMDNSDYARDFFGKSLTLYANFPPLLMAMPFREDETIYMN